MAIEKLNRNGRLDSFEFGSDLDSQRLVFFSCSELDQEITTLNLAQHL